MEKKNKFVIIITSYNDEDWVDYNIASILNQNYTNYEVMYYDDASTDNTYSKVKTLAENDNRFKIFTRTENKQALHSYIECLDNINDEDILVCVSGDDWLFDENVLNNLNNYYNNNDVWMTYGKFYCWDGKSDSAVEANPQNTPYPDLVHKYKLYKKDVWRASHLRTFKGFLIKKVYKEHYRSKIDLNYFDHASDLAISFPCLEMCGKERIGVVDFPTYIYNVSNNNQERTHKRESNSNNQKYELEIRTRKTYSTLVDKNSNPVLLPQINVFGDNKERHSIPTNFTYVYNQTNHEHDLTLLQDDAILKYLNKEIIVDNTKPIVALVAEGPHLFNQEEVYSKVIANHKKFHTILGWHESLHNLPNHIFYLITEISQWNLLPEELDTTKFKIYNKTKLVSFITSNKNLCSGHKLRLDCKDYIQKQNLNVDIFGRGINPIKAKVDGLKDYYYSIAMENDKLPYYFTEKIIDCFLTGTIPIYYGCNNIDKFFNPKGILTFNTTEELVNIINNLTVDFYQKNKNAIEENFEIAQSLWMNNDRFFNKFIKEIL